MATLMNAGGSVTFVSMDVELYIQLEPKAEGPGYSHLSNLDNHADGLRSVSFVSLIYSTSNIS